MKDRFTRVIGMLCLALVAVQATPVDAQSVVVDLPLKAKSDCTAPVCTALGGNFTSSGWTVAGLNNKIAIDTLDPIDSGIAEIDVTNFNPPKNGQQGTSSENYCMIFSNLQTPAGDHNTVQANHEAAYEILSIWCDYDTGQPETNCNHSYRERSLKLVVWGPGGQQSAEWIGANGSHKTFTWDETHTYHIRVEWDATSAKFTATDKGPAPAEGSGSVTREWYYTPQNPSPQLRYIFIGRNNGMCDPIIGATYSNLKVTKNSDPCDKHCSNKQQDCGESGVDCGGGCPPCPSDDAGQPDTGTDAGQPQDAGVDAGHHRDVGVDAGIAEDSGIAEDIGSRDTGLPADGSAGPDGGQPRDTGPFADAGHHPDDAAVERDAGQRPDSGAVGVGEESVGCSCAFLTH